MLLCKLQLSKGKNKSNCIWSKTNFSFDLVSWLVRLKLICFCLSDWMVFRNPFSSSSSSSQDNGSVRVGGPGHWEVCAWLLQWDLPLHHVWGAALCGPHPEALHRHLPGEFRPNASAPSRKTESTHNCLFLTVWPEARLNLTGFRSGMTRDSSVC